MLRDLLIQLWKDESGVIATEYLMLSSIVALGSATGLAAMRDSITDEYKDFGQNMRETRQSFMKPTAHTTTGTAGVGAVPNTTFAPPPGQAYAPTFATVAPVPGQVFTPTFSAP